MTTRLERQAKIPPQWRASAIIVTLVAAAATVALWYAGLEQASHTLFYFSVAILALLAAGFTYFRSKP